MEYSLRTFTPRLASFSVMIELRFHRSATKYDAAQPRSSGKRPTGCRVVSNAKTIDVRGACDAPAKIAAMPTSPATDAFTPRLGAQCAAAAPASAPRPLPIVKRGAIVPPDVPLPR